MEKESEGQKSLVVQDGRYQFFFAIVLTGVIPLLCVVYLLMIAHAGEVHPAQVYLISACLLVLTVVGYSLLYKYPVTVMRVRDTLRRIVEGDLPETVSLRTSDLEIRNIEQAINLIVQQLKQHIESVQREKSAVEQELYQAQKLEAMGVMAAGIAHEVNTPTQFIGDNARFLAKVSKQVVKLVADVRRELEAARATANTASLEQAVKAMADGVDIAALDRDVESAVRDTQEGIERIKGIVQAVRDFAHVSTEGARVPLDLNRVVQSTLAISRNEWKYVADAETDLDPHLPPVPCVWGDMNQVLLNLVVNASQAIAARPEGRKAPRGKIRVVTRVEGDMAVISITDNGTGMTVENAARVFDLFYTTKKKSRRGMGIGLPIARFLVTRRHGGSLTLETELGKGTTFFVRLPLAAAAGGFAEDPSSGQV
jgi:signal transduction histidine kinase